MKVFLLQEFRVGFSKKFIAVLLMASLFSFSFSAYHSFKYSQELSDLRELRIMDAENQLITEESNVWVYEEMGGSELVDLMQERKLCMQRILDGYNSGNMFQVLESQIEANEIQQEAKSYGLRMDSDEEKERRDQSELNKILLEKNILPYDPLIEPHDGVSSLLFLLKNIMLFLVPLVVMLNGTYLSTGLFLLYGHLSAVCSILFFSALGILIAVSIRNEAIGVVCSVFIPVTLLMLQNWSRGNIYLIPVLSANIYNLVTQISVSVLYAFLIQIACTAGLLILADFIFNKKDMA